MLLYLVLPPSIKPPPLICRAFCVLPCGTMAEQSWKPPPMFAPARVYLAIMSVGLLNATGWAVLFFYFGAPWTGLLSVGLGVWSCVGLAHATLFQRLAAWKPYFLFPIGLIGLGLNWSLGPGVSGYAAVPVMLLPHVILTTGGSRLQVQGCIRRAGTSEVAPEAVRQAVGGGCRSGCGRLLSVANAIEAGICR